MSAGKKSFEVRISVPFFDLDPMQIVWHGNYLNYFEIARAALFEHHGVDLYSYYEREKIIFPIIRTATKHIFPLKHRDEIIVKATLVDAHIKLVVDFEIHHQLDVGIHQRGLDDDFVAVLERKNMLRRRPDDGENDFFPLVIRIEIDAVVLEKRRARDFKIVEIIAVPDDLHGIQVEKRHADPDFEAFFARAHDCPRKKSV